MIFVYTVHRYCGLTVARCGPHTLWSGSIKVCCSLEKVFFCNSKGYISVAAYRKFFV